MKSCTLIAATVATSVAGTMFVVDARGFPAPVAQERPEEPCVDGLFPVGHPLADVQQLLLRGESTAARARLVQLQRTLPAGELAALRAPMALLDAAAAGPLERPDAMLAVAAAWPDSSEAEVALVAGLRAWQAIREEELDLFAPLLPASRTGNEAATDGAATSANLPFDEAALATFMATAEARLAAFGALVRARASASPQDPELLHQAQQLLMRLGMEEERFLRLRCGERLRLPVPLMEGVRLRIDRLSGVDDDLTPWLTAAPAVPPLFECSFEPGCEQRGEIDRLPVLEAGTYVVQLESPAHGWRRVRKLLVSDLDLLVQSRGGSCVVLALLDGKPAPDVVVDLDRDLDGTESAEGADHWQGRTDARGLCAFAGELGDLRWLRGRSQGRAGAADQLAVGPLPFAGTWFRGDDQLAHVMVDAPLHRRGETMEGRVIARAVERLELPALAGAVDRQPHVAPLAGTPLVLRFWPKSAHERCIEGTTDEDGVLAFQLAIDESAPLGDVSLVIEHPVDYRRNLWDGTPCRIEAVKRPPLLLDLGWPAPFMEGDARPAVTVTATLPSGAAAVELAGMMTVTLGSFVERHPFQLDGAGRATLPIACDTLAPELLERLREVAIKIEVTAPDGQVVREHHELSLAREARAAAKGADDNALLRDRVLSLRAITPSARAGDAVDIEVTGPPGAAVLLTAGRTCFWWDEVVVLDGTGTGHATLATQQEWWPWVHVDASMLRSGRESDAADSLVIRLEAPTGPVRAELAEAGRRFAPGQTATMHCVTRDGRGAPVPALVTVAIVDESLFLLAPDRTPAPSRSLLPDVPYVSCRPAWTETPASPWQVIGEMLAGGRVKSPLDHGSSGAAPHGLGGGGNATAPGGAGDGLREMFRPIAAFIAKVSTDEEGRGEFEVAFPDDLTRWRVTLVATTADGRGEITRSNVTTERDPSLVLLPPRFLRHGDTLAIPSVASARDGAPRRVALFARTEGGLALLEDAARSDTLVAGRPLRESWNVRADAGALGSLRVDLIEATLEGPRPEDPADTNLFNGEKRELLDGEKHELPLLPRTVTRVTTATTVVRAGAKEPILLAPPLLADSLSNQVTLRLLGDRAALLTDAGEWLAGYPYGCAEQTISRLVPVFAAARARRLATRSDASHAPRVDLTPEQARRFELGMARLRDLATADGYAWWRDGGPDLAMTPVVLTGLALAREAGLDPAAYGAIPDWEKGFLGSCVRELAAATGDPTAAATALVAAGEPDSRWIEMETEPAQTVAEIAVAILRLIPDHALARSAVGALVRGDHVLSASLLARAGRALAGAGDLEGARRCWDRLQTATAAVPCVVPLEDAPAAFAAHRLELARALALPDDALRSAEAELLGLFADGRFGTTWATAVALCALACDEQSEPMNVGPQRLRVRVEGVDQPVALTAASKWRAELELGATERIELIPAAGCDVIAVAERRHLFDGVTGTGWTAPIEVERTLSRMRLEASGRVERSVLAPDADGSFACEVGDLLEVDVTLRGPPDLTYFVVTCPLPAGCELVGRGGGLEVDGTSAEEERLVWAFADLGTGGQRRASARFVVGLAGDVAWPPAQVEAMYRPALSGATRGARLVMSPRASRPLATASTWLTPEARQQWVAELVAAVKYPRDVRLRSGFLHELADAPDDRVESILRREVVPAAIDWTEDVRPLLHALGIQRAGLLDGQAWSTLAAAQPQPPSELAVEEWASQLGDFTEGQALVERWTRRDTTLGTFECRLAALAWIGREHWSRWDNGIDATLDPSLLLRALRVEDIAPEHAEARHASHQERWEWLADRVSLAAQMEATCRTVCLMEGIRTRPEDVALLRPLTDWKPLIEFLRRELAVDLPPAPVCTSVARLLAFSPPSADGAPPFAEEQALAEAVESLRTTLTEAILRRLERGLGVGEIEGLEELARGPDRAAAQRRVLRLVEAAERVEQVASAHDETKEALELGITLLDELDEEVTLASPVGARISRWLAEGPPAWRPALLAALPREERARLPLSLLVAGLDDSAVADLLVDALVLRPDGASFVIDALADRLPREVASHAIDEVVTRAEALALLGDEKLLELVPDLEVGALRLVRREIATRIAVRPAVFAAALARPQDPRIRELLVELLAEAHRDDVPWNPGDPTASRYRTLLRCRLGAADAVEAVRGWLRADRAAQADTTEEKQAEHLPYEERSLLQDALLGRAMLNDLQELLFEDYDADRLASRFAAVDAQEVTLWLESWERGARQALAAGRPPTSPLAVLEALPDESLHRAWDQLERTWGRFADRLDADDRWGIACWFLERTGLSLTYAESDGERTTWITCAPEDPDEWRKALRQRIAWTRAVPDLSHAEPGLRAAWRSELVERGLANPATMPQR